MTMDEEPRNLPTTTPEAPREAREQADEYESIFGRTPLALDGDDVLMVPPHPDYGMLDDDRMDEYDEYKFVIDTQYDREPDIFIPEQRLRNEQGAETGIVMPAETQRGAVKTPFRITDAAGNTTLVKPAHSVRVVQIALGDVDYKRLRAGGRNASDVWKIWGRQSLLIKERQQRDSKSAASPVALAAVPTPNSQ